MLFYGLILSITCQVVATLIAISMIRRTRYNISWLFISGAFVLMAIRRMIEAKTLVLDPDNTWGNINNWLGVGISIFLLLGTVYIKKIFDLQDKIKILRDRAEGNILNAIISTEEKSRQQFAKELHDGIGPLLSTIKMSISAINKEEIGDQNKVILDKTNQAIQEAITAVKEISNNLSPHILNNFGLLKALQNFTDHMPAKEIDIMISSNIDGNRYTYNTEVTLYRILCELINNTVKHASAKKIEIDLHEEGNNLVINYLDDGVGFDPQELESNHQGLGFPNIQSRIKSLNGNIEMFTKPNEGFMMKISVST